MNGPETVLLFTAPAVAVAAAGSALASWWRPGPRLTSAVQHLAAGIMFAAAALELLPRERHEAALAVAIGFALGLVLMLAMRQLARRVESRSRGRTLPVSLVLVTGIDLALDGIVLGIGFAAGEHTGILLSVALTLEVLFVALSIASELADAGAGRLASVLVPTGLAMLLGAAGAFSRALLGGIGPFTFAMLLGTGTVALLYLVVEELLVEAHEVEETPWATAAFFLGFLLFLLIEMAVR